MNQRNQVVIDITMQKKNFLSTFCALPLLFIYFKPFLSEKCFFLVEIKYYMLDVSNMSAKCQNKTKRSELNIE